MTKILPPPFEAAQFEQLQEGDRKALAEKCRGFVTGPLHEYLNQAEATGTIQQDRKTWTKPASNKAFPPTRIGVLAAESRCRDDLAMIDFFRQTILAQFQAALWMLDDCIRNCPEENWSGPNAIVGKYEVWHIVHHTLSCTDGYLSPDEKYFSPRPQFHPAGEKDIEDEYPSRQFAKEEMLEYVAVVRQKLGEALAAETEESLRGPSGFSWVEINRAELHLYNMRHVMHHTGMISAFLRRLDLPKEAQPRWGFTGWRE